MAKRRAAIAAAARPKKVSKSKKARQARGWSSSESDKANARKKAGRQQARNRENLGPLAGIIGRQNFGG